jgi:predicted transcriptional regulator
MTGRPPGTSPASALTGALGSPWPELQHTARAIVARAVAGRTREQAADELGVTRSTLQRILAENKDILGTQKKVKKST